ncbi:MAG: c-type cytochrome [Pseudomonadales bacterium]
MHTARRKLLLATVLCLTACGQVEQPFESPQLSANEASQAMTKWARSCALCHVNGEGGAPSTGDQDAWRERLAKGQSTLLTHTIEGFNRMPAMGYCYDCTESEYLHQIAFMAGKLEAAK